MLGPARCAGCGSRFGWLCDSCAGAAASAPGPAAMEGIECSVAPWAYVGAPRSLILALKLRGARSAAAPLIVGMARACRRTGVSPACVTWVPARRTDARRRGFDHAEVLARGLARELGLPAARSLARRGVQADQSGLDRRARLANLAGAFVAPRPVDSSLLLVDDLVTTGATAMACAAALRAAGGRRIVLVTACRV